jgi:uncharacterized repeat protein (TIGR01451 family)
MKSTKTLKAILMSVAALTVPYLASATLIWDEGFQYPNGSLAATNTTLAGFALSTSGGIWSRFSGSAIPSDMYVVNSNVQVVASYGTSGGINIYRQDDCCRYFATTNGTTAANMLLTYANTNYDAPQLLYASFTVMCSTAISNSPGLPNSGGSYFATFYSGTNYGNPLGPTTTNAEGYGFCGRVQAFTNGTVVPNTWRMGVTDNTLGTNSPDGGFPVDLAVNTSYQVVEEIDPITLQACTIWVNPTDPNQTGNSPTETHYTASDSMGKMLTYGVNAYAFRQASSMGPSVFIVTNLAIATTFAEAFTNVAPTNALPPTIAYQPANVHNFPGSSFNLSVVANGQGLANLTYTWQENSNNISNPNGNSNILPFSSMPFGTNYYDVIVTTPYGLSTTSSVATVNIDSTPQPPIITTQPASQALYQSQNLNLSINVASPGNVTFTWYSNGVVTTYGVSSSQYSSSLQINSVVTANAATYYVTVTNDVFATGVVSSNAAVTILTPASVSIGYLHTLVGAGTYVATNVPPSIAYQVTGVVTTATNITSGNTASYYLQDATGGINIFVTGASTFRPQLGDTVTYVGVLSSYLTGLELYADTADSSFPYTSFTDLGPGVLPSPKPISYNIMTNIAFANTNLGGEFVEISDVHFGTNAGFVTSSGGNTTISVTNSAGKLFTLFFPSIEDLDVAGQTLPTTAYTVAGALYSANNTVTNEIVVTSWTNVNTINPVADVSVTMSTSTNVAVGNSIIYTLFVTNTGPVTATNTILTNAIPFGTTFVSASGSGVNNGGVVTWNLGNVPPSTGSTSTLVVATSAAGSVTNVASAGSSTPEFNPADNTSSKFITTVTPSVDLAATLSVPSFVFANSNLSYTISVTNLGPSTASAVVVTSSVPFNTTFVSASGLGVNNAGVVNWVIGSFALAGSSNLTLVVKAPASGLITNSAYVTSTTPETITNNNTTAKLITSVAPLPVAGPIKITGGNPVISWNVVAGPTYSVWWSTNVSGPYSSIASGLTTSPYTDSLHPNQTSGFYQITVP